MGDTLLGRYEIKRELGRGSGGKVYLALDRLRNRQVALKEVARPAGLLQLRREFEILRSIDHPGVAKALDYTEDASAARAWLAQEYVPGPCLPEAAAGLDQRTVARMAMQLALVLHHLHSRGLAHADVKPANVIVPDPEEQPVLVDFGLASAGETAGEARGTPAYMAPEIFRGAGPSPVTDIYSLGATIYHCLAGEPPYAGESIEELVGAGDHGKPVSLRKKRGDIDPPLAGIVDKMLHPDPVARYQSAGTAARHLAEYLGEEIPARAWRGGRWPLVGRDEELARLAGLIERLKAGEPAGHMFITGKRGSGTSRLLEAVADRARTSGVRVLYIPLGRGTDLPSALWKLLEMDEDQGADADMDGRERTRFRAYAQIARALSSRASEWPVLLALDDFEQASPSSVELARFLCLEFNHGFGSPEPVALMAACAGALPEEISDDAAAGWLGEMTTEPLSVEAVAELAKEYWGYVPSPDAAEKLTHLCGGNPLWLREILQAAPGEEFIWELSAPESLRQLARRAASALSPEFIRLLEAMAVIGVPATTAEIAFMLDEQSGRVTNMLAELTGGEMVKAEAGTYSISNPLLAECILSDTALSVKRRLHHAAAEVLEKRGNSPAEAVALHMMEAGEAENALPYVLEAGKQLRARGSHREAAQIHEKALETGAADAPRKKALLEGLAASAAPAGLWKKALAALRERLETADDDPPETRAGFHLDMAHCQQRIGEYERAERAVARALGELAGRDGPAQYRRAREISALLEIARGGYDKAAAVCEDAISELAPDSPASAPFHAASGIAHVYKGEYRRAADKLDTAVNLYERDGEPAGMVTALAGLGMARQQTGDHEGALEAYRRALELAKKEGDLRSEATVQMNIATVEQERKRWDDALQSYRRALRLARQTGARSDEVRILGNLGNLLLCLGDAERALPLVERSLIDSKRLGLKIYRAYAHILRGDIFKTRGEMMSARREYLRALRTFESLGNHREAAQALLRLGRLYIEMRERSRAADAIAMAADKARRLGNRSFESEAFLLKARWELEWGRPDEAVSSAKEAIELAPEGAGKGAAWEIRAVLGAALLKECKREEALEQLQSAHDAAIEMRDNVPEAYRDTFLSGKAWEELSNNLEAAGNREGLIPESRWKKLVEINRRLTAQLGLGKLLELIMDSVLELIEAERGFLILVEDDGLSIPVARNIDRESIRSPRMKISRSIAEEVTTTGEPLITVDARRDSRLDRFASVQDLKLRSVLCIPLRMKDETIGTLYVDNRFREGAFREEDLALMQAFADQAAIAIENARQSEKLEERSAKIRQLAEELENRLDRQAARMEAMQAELAGRALSAEGKYPEIIGRSIPMREVYALMERVIASDVPVLIEGESGTGKELVARAIHFNGPRKDKRFLSENCSAIPETLLESELFGYEKGAFTGAAERKIGLLEIADGGTMLLDEIGDMSPGMQAKLLRVIQEGEIRRVGGQETIKVDVRVISATHQKLEELVRTGRFRQDLYWRLNVVKISLPPLRERREDIPALAEHFCKVFSSETGHDVRIGQEAMRILMAYDWPGNVRELENEIRKAAVLGEGDIEPTDLSPRILEAVGGRRWHAASHAVSGKLKNALEGFEKEYLARTLRECGGNRAEAARRLGIGRRTLYDKLARYEIGDEDR